MSDKVALLVADVPWAVFLPALRETSGETFEVRSAVTDATAWRQNSLDWRRWSLLAGEYDGRSYVMGAYTGPTEADRVVALAAHTGGLVLGHEFQDNVGWGEMIAARGPRLLHYLVDSQWGQHEEGEPLPGEGGGDAAAFPEGFQALIAALGFDLGGWLRAGAKWDLLWTSLEKGEQPEAFARLYFGPLRQRVEWIHRAGLEDL